MHGPKTHLTKELHRCFNKDEHANIHATYELIIGQSMSLNDGKAYATEKQLKAFIGGALDEHFVHGIITMFEKYSKMDEHHEPKSTFTLCGFTSSLAFMIASTMEDTGKAILCAANGTCLKESNVEMKVFEKFVTNLVSSYMRILSTTKEYNLWNFASESDESVLVNAILSSFETLVCSDTVNINQLTRQLSDNSLLLSIWNSLIRHVFQLKITSNAAFTSIPIPANANWLTMQPSILSPSGLLFLTNYLPIEQQQVWRLMYSNSGHGTSFTTLSHSISAQGTCVVVIRDIGGHVFGAYCSHGFVTGSHFKGDERTFLFTLSPTMRTYHPTGYNNHFAYLNISQETMLNGLGVGGTIEPNHYFALWINDDCRFGKSQPTTSTFHCPQLSSVAIFEIDSIEIWATENLTPIECDNSEESILDRDLTLTALLTIAGRTQYSAGLRDGEHVHNATMPEEHHLHTA